jgi:poly-gamma-glutamate capsule biosynthesis protein CapA/YwtB (metallophosphatase superfamily)
MINEVPVFYGLGNFVFDQSWSVEVSGSVILQVTFEGTHYKGYTLTPVISQMDGKVLRANKEQAAQILTSIEKASQKLH